MTALSADLIRLCALALGHHEHHFDDRFDRHVSSLVANYYYPRLAAPLPGQLRRGAHTDFGGLTVLYQEDDLGGLQVLRGDDDWRDVRAIPDRLSIPFFYQPNHDAPAERSGPAVSAVPSFTAWQCTRVPRSHQVELDEQLIIRTTGPREPRPKPGMDHPGWASGTWSGVARAPRGS